MENILIVLSLALFLSVLTITHLIIIFFAITTCSGDNCEDGDVQGGFKTAISSKTYKRFSGIRNKDATLL